MLRLLLLFLTIGFVWGASGDADLLTRADRKAASSDKTEIFSAYNDYKNLYLRAMRDGDTSLKAGALRGIVKTGNALSIDVEKYEEELKGMPRIAAPRPTVRKQVKKADVSTAGYHSMRSVRWRDDRLVLRFSGNLQAHEVNYFKLFDKKTRRYRYIFDIHAIMPHRSEELHHSQLRAIRLSQHNANTVRLVVENDKRLKVRFKRQGKELVINLGVKADTRSTRTSNRVKLAERYHLEESFWRGGKLVLRFDATPATSQVRVSKLLDRSAKRYRYIYDFKGAMIRERQSLSHQQLKRISLAQFDTKTLRLVVENDRLLEVDHEIGSNEVVIDLGLSEVDAPAAQPAQRPASVRKVIVIDPGHGGKDAGAVGHKKYREKVVVMQIARELSKLLKKQGYTVHMTRNGDSFIKLQKRTSYANAKNADLFISIHANAVPKRNIKKASGIETYFLSNDHEAGSERAKRVAAMENSKDLRDVNFYGQQDFINILNREKIKMSERLAYDLQGNILAELRKHYKHVKDGGVREGPFWILVGAQMPAVLVEVGFITHPTEAERLASRNYQKRFAQGLANGINQYFYYNP